MRRQSLIMGFGQIFDCERRLLIDIKCFIIIFQLQKLSTQTSSVIEKTQGRLSKDFCRSFLQEDFSPGRLLQKSFTKSQISDELRSNLKLTCLSEKTSKKVFSQNFKIFVYKGTLEDLQGSHLLKIHKMSIAKLTYALTRRLLKKSSR